MSGKDPLAPPMDLPIVDVRDVAMMHVAAIELESAKGERFAATADTLRFLELASILKNWDPKLKMVSKEAPGWLMRIIAIFMADVRPVIPNIGRTLSVSGAKAERVFGFQFIPAKDALIASAKAVKQYKD